MPRARLLGMGLGLGALLCLAFVVSVPLFGPLDERSHWLTVLAYRRWTGLPGLGDVPPPTYEALQQGPVYYALAAALVRLQRGGFVALYALRLLGIPMLIATSYLDLRLAALVFPDRRVARSLLFLLAVGPALASLFAGIQNDGLAVLGATLAMYLAARWSADGRLDLRRGAALGAVVGATLLTKSSTAFLLVSVPVAILLVRRRAGVGPVAVALVVAALVCGWWFARNQVLYGDLTGQAALLRLPPGTAPRPLPLGSLDGEPVALLFPWVSWFRAVALAGGEQAGWIPRVVRYGSYLALALGVLGGALRRWSPLEFGVLAHVAVAWLAYLVALTLTNSDLAGRTTFAVLPLALMLLLVGWRELAGRLGRRWLADALSASVVLMFVAADVVVLVSQVRRH